MNIDNLNEKQKQAVLMLERPVCILAGAGTGKTRVITHRVAHLIANEGADPRSVMALSFTNKAATEMRERVERLLPYQSAGIQLGTFHSIALRWLRRLGHLVSLPSGFLIYDEDDSYRVKKQLAGEQFHIPKEALDGYLKLIEAWQNEGLASEDVAPRADAFEEKARALYVAYEKKLLENGAIDFNGILFKWKALLLNENAFALFSREVRHLLVDEYQDTNPTQADIVHRIAEAANSVAIVGDDDQSIYGWRGAKANHLQRFLNEVPNACLVKLEENYRSQKNILALANAVIAHNEERLGKTLFTRLPEGERITVMRARSDRAEADSIIDKIRLETLRGAAGSDFAILMRTNSQSRLFEEALRRSRIPFKLIGGVKFYDRKEIKDALATLRVALNPKSDVDFMRALSACPRGVGEASLEKVRAIAQVKKCSLATLCANTELLKEAGLPKRAHGSLVDFATRLSELGQASLHLDAEQAVVEAISVSGLSEKLTQANAPEDLDRLENLNQLVLSARTFVEEAQKTGSPTDAFSFLEVSALVSASDERYSEDDRLGGAITLMTLHAAKGLEFDTVFLVGLEEYGFPHARALSEDAPPEELEEERRLAYVGITRARRRLFLSYAEQRMVFGSVKPRSPSRFLGEMPPELVGTPGFSLRPQTSRPQVSNANERRIVLEEEFIPRSAQSPFQKGVRVNHASFGRGTVIDNRGSGALPLAVVRFDKDRSERAIVTTHLSML